MPINIEVSDPKPDLKVLPARRDHKKKVLLGIGIALIVCTVTGVGVAVELAREKEIDYYMIAVQVASEYPNATSAEALHPAFAAWMATHAKQYETGEEVLAAMRAYTEVDQIINEHNAKNLTYTLGHNAYSDLPANARNRRNGHISRPPKTEQNAPRTAPTPSRRELSSVPSSVDWVSAGAVTAIKDQGTCGSCYSFASTGALEGAYEIAGYTLTSFSEEMIVQCADDGVNLLGCDGGNADSVFGWIESHGLASESAYPYTSSQTATYSYAGACDTAKESSPVVELTGFQDVTANDEIALKAAVAQQPVAVAIDASGNDFQSYASGVYDSTTCTTQTDHAVLIVGYGTDPTGGDYWKVKNSWGTSWGEAGYIRMKRGVNMCGIATEASYPTGVGPYSPSPPSSSYTYSGCSECSNTCQWSYDGECDDGGSGSEYSACTYATDCYDCGNRC